MAEAITRLEDLREGDIFLGPIGGLVGLGISVGELLVDGGFRVGDLDVRHIGIVTSEYAYSEDPETGTGRSWSPQLAQAMPSGAEIVTMTPERHWGPRCAYVRLPEDYPGQAADAAAIARLMVREKVGYSFASYAALAAWHWGLSTPRLEAWIGRRRESIFWESGYWGNDVDSSMIELPCEAICSVFADQAWSLTGKRIMVGVPHQCVTPSQLAARLLTLEGVTWGWPDRYPVMP